MEIILNDKTAEQLLIADITNYLELSDDEMMDHALSYSCNDQPLNIELSREENLFKLIIKRGCICRFNELVNLVTPYVEEEIYEDENADNLPNKYFEKVPEMYSFEVMKVAANREVLRFSEVLNSEPAFLGFNYRTNSLVFISRSSNALKIFFAFFLSSYKSMSEVELKKYHGIFERKTKRNQLSIKI